MSAVNSFSLVGRLVGDVKTREFKDGKIAMYTIAVNGNQDKADYIPITTYGKQAENDAQYLGKGAMVAVSGSIASWYKSEENKGGFNFSANSVRYLSKPSPSSGNKEQHSETSAVPAAASQTEAPDEWLQEYMQAEMGQSNKR